jgi:hypothetical protein
MPEERRPPVTGLTRSKQRAKVLRVLLDADAPLSAVRIGALASMPTEYVRRHLGILEKAGWVYPPGQDPPRQGVSRTYQLTPHGRYLAVAIV